ncbi:MAG: RNA polymerase factor sigma-54 [Phycisphaerae bacterium]
MRLDSSQHMRLEQRMKLAPQMIQSMEILQLGTMALEERIDDELAANPVLEREEASIAQGPDLTPVAGMPPEAATPALSENAAANTAPEIEPNANNFDDYIPSARSSSAKAGERDPKMEAMANTAARGASLQEQLHQQWSLIDDIAPAIQRGGSVLIDWVDVDGYLRDSLDTICRELPQGVRREDLERALPIIQQRLEPAGVCARDLKESLLLQIDASSRDQHLDLSTARTLITHYLQDLELNRLPQIAAKSGLTLEQINEAKSFMARHLHPRPGRLLADRQVPMITPDAIIEPDEQTGEYRIRLTDDRLPRLYINSMYSRMARARSVDTGTRHFISNNIRNARWLIEAIEQRRNTLLRVLRVVVDAQKEFIEMGPEFIKPLPMTGVADQLGVHVATVSRTVADKYVQTPRGIFPLRAFFSGGMENSSGETVSFDAIKAKLLEVISQEDKQDPLNDDEIVEQLKTKGLTLARRTVAKYRKICKIAPARQRRQYT